MKKDSNGSASTNHTGYKAAQQRSNTVTSNPVSRVGSHKQTRMGDQTTMVRKGGHGNASANAEKFSSSG